MVQQWLESIRALWPECPAHLGTGGNGYSRNQPDAYHYCDVGRHRHWNLNQKWLVRDRSILLSILPKALLCSLLACFLRFAPFGQFWTVSQIPQTARTKIWASKIPDHL